MVARKRFKNMDTLHDKLLPEIEKGLRQSWMSAQASRIETEADKIKGNDMHAGAQRQRIREDMSKEANNKFEKLWSEKIKNQLTEKLNSLYEPVRNNLVTRHPWLENEKAVGSTISLMDDFLNNTIRAMLFNLLKNKPAGANNWNKILVSDQNKLEWAPINEQWLNVRSQGYPLSNASFYHDRDLPSYLQSPFDIGPMRYDVYRLLIKIYKKKFTPTKLNNGVFCTQIAPLHHTELASLSKDEWGHFETMIVNIGEEAGPKWVLLNKSENAWTVYLPSFLQNDFQQIMTQIINTPISTSTIQTVKTPVNAIYNSITDWHAVLFSEVLPWCEISEPQKQPLDTYRSTLPISLLFQNTLEACCLDSQKKVEAASQKAFATRYPLSEFDEKLLYNSSPKIDKYLFAKISISPASKVIKAFDDKEITYDPHENPHDGRLKIQKAEQFFEGMKLAYYHKVGRLDLNMPADKAWNNWFAYNLEMTQVQSKDDKNYAFMHACAARNRFLEFIEPNYLTQTSDEITARQTAWQNTGEYIHKFFTQNANNPVPEQCKNIAQMGTEGLNTWFNYLENLSNPAQLSCTLDLDSGQAAEITDYISTLTKKIENYTKTPLFSNLELILPNPLSDAQQELIDLISVLNNKKEIKELILKNPKGINKTLLLALIKDAKQNKICLQIQIPEWDETVFDSPQKSSLKALYRALQNTILANIREKREPKLQNNTASIEKPLPVAFPLKKTNSALTDSINDDQTWDKDKFYTLASVGGIQQQAEQEQELAQEVQEQAEKQAQPAAPVVRKPVEYQGNENQLITRGNLQHGITLDDFSAWVGSKEDADFVIEKMDKAAADQLQKFKSLFKFGIDSEHTPGFRLYYSSREKKTLILTYDETLVAEDLLALKDDPFFIQMNDCQKAIPFCGDYRQFDTLKNTPIPEQLGLWRHTAKENVTQNIQTWLNNKGLSTTSSEVLQYSDANNQSEISENIQDEKEITEKINYWVNGNSSSSEPFNNLTDKNLKAFGQIFYHYGAPGTKDFLSLVNQINLIVPKEVLSSTENLTTNEIPQKTKFSIYKERLLDPLEDWSECLEKSEVEALTASMKKLANHPEHQNILWALIDAHGESVGRMRFAEVWRAYDAVITYLNANDLKINQEQFLKAIEAYPENFNATQFLRRLYTVLEHTGNKQDSPEIQQQIIDNLSRIDWHENGFYYACVHEHYRYWDPKLKLEGFQTLGDKPLASYSATWDGVYLDQIQDPVGYTLRYAAQRLKLNKQDFDTFKDIINNINDQCPDNKTDLMRLITASLALGIDNIDGLKKIQWQPLGNPEYKTLLQTMNQTLKLNATERLSGSYHVRMGDLPVLLEALQKNPNTPLDLDTINAFGRALQACHAENEKSSRLDKLILYGNNKKFNDPLITAYPWLVNDPIQAPPKNNEHLTKFYNQLSSIDFKISKLPTKDQLEQILNSINSPQTRETAVKQLINDGCLIRDQDTEFRSLNKTEKSVIKNIFLCKTFEQKNRKLLEKLFERLAIKQEGDTDNKIQAFLNMLSSLDKKNYDNELGQLLGLLLEQSQGSRYYSIEQLTVWLEAVFDQNEFKTKPYPVGLIKVLLRDALNDPNSSLLNNQLAQLKTKDDALDPLKLKFAEINRSDLSDPAKKTIAKYAMSFKHEQNVQTNIDTLKNILLSLNKSSDVTASLCDLINTQLDKDQTQLNLEILKKLVNSPKNHGDICERHQIKLLDGLKTDAYQLSSIKALSEIPDPITRAILSGAFIESEPSKDNQNTLKLLINKIAASLTNKGKEELLELAEYYKSNPKPTLQQLDSLLNQFNKSANLIDHFERVLQAKDKRNYSLKPTDADDIRRALGGFKLKNQGKYIEEAEQVKLVDLLYYMNTYSQVFALQDKTPEELFLLIQENKDDESPQAKARIMACIREIVLRKTGKWAKDRSQMLALLYSTLHDDENLLYQVRTGEGKSIISLMRVAYRALKGRSVAVFSAKDSLSKRDHEEASPVLDALGIRHNHFGAKEDPSAYHNQPDQNGVGAIHYAIIGNLSLFLSDMCWNNKGKEINLNARKWDAFLDEGDHIMRSENTLFNLPDQTGPATVYNFDAWVYEIAYQYYLEKFANNATNENELKVYESPHLEELYAKLKEAAETTAPKESTFFTTYLATGDNEFRNQKLLGLLSAAHGAKKLKEGVDFCVMTEQKKLGGDTTQEKDFAKVMIKNQVYHGSTYSDLVQQFLHVRLNNEPTEKRPNPNFFIEPASEIALSLDASYVLKHYFEHIEAVTGTPGGEEALEFYQNEFGIDNVLKIPTYADIKTIFLPPIYADNLEAQVAEIVASIQKNPDQPILITCEDDDEVKKLGALIQKALSNNNRNLVIDTNDTGLSEAHILKDAGLQGALTISSRLGRGSDIQPYDTEKGLIVIRTYPAPPEEKKQEDGRTARNGAGGECQDIIDYSAVQKDLDLFKNDPKFIALFKYESGHLEIKLAKHQASNQSNNPHKPKKQIWIDIGSYPSVNLENEKFDNLINNPTLKVKYLLTRTVQRYKQEIKAENRQRIAAKNALIIDGSAQVMAYLRRRNLKEYDRSTFKKAWKACQKAIVENWDEKKPDTSQSILNHFYQSYQITRQEMPKNLKQNAAKATDVKVEPGRVAALIAFHRSWLTSLNGTNLKHNQPVVDAIYGAKGQQLDSMYRAFETLNVAQLKALTEIVSNSKCHTISCEAWTKAIHLCFLDQESSLECIERIDQFFKQNFNEPPPKSADDVANLSKAFLAAVEGVPNLQFIEDIIRERYTGYTQSNLIEKVSQFPKTVVDLCKKGMNKEDIIFFLKTLDHKESKDVIDYLTNNYEKLKNSLNTLRPLIPLLLQGQEIRNLLSNNLKYNNTTASLLCFLNKRPNFDTKDFIELEEKINRIEKLENQLMFLGYLSAIPPHVSVKDVLNDLDDLPGKCSFENWNADLAERIQLIKAAATAFNTFLFDHGLISNKGVNTASENNYEEWCTIFSDFSLQERVKFFNSVEQLNHISLETLTQLADGFKNSGIANLNLSIHELRRVETKPSDVKHIETSVEPSKKLVSQGTTSSVSTGGWSIFGSTAKKNESAEDKKTNPNVPT